MFQNIKWGISVLLLVSAPAFAAEIEMISATPIVVKSVPLSSIPMFDQAATYFRFEPSGSEAHFETTLYRTFWVGHGPNRQPIHQLVRILPSNPEGLFYDHKNQQIYYSHADNLTLCANVKQKWNSWKIYPTGNCMVKTRVQAPTPTQEALFVVELFLKN